MAAEFTTIQQIEARITVLLERKRWHVEQGCDALAKIDNDQINRLLSERRDLTETSLA